MLVLARNLCALCTLCGYCVYCTTTASAEDSMQALIEAEAAATAAVSAAQERTAAVTQQLQQSQAAAAALTTELAAAQEDLLITRTLARVQSRSSLNAGEEGSTLRVLLCVTLVTVTACMYARSAHRLLEHDSDSKHQSIVSQQFGQSSLAASEPYNAREVFASMTLLPVDLLALQQPQLLTVLLLAMPVAITHC
jgi:hypothetical protein